MGSENTRFVAQRVETASEARANRRVLKMIVGRVGGAMPWAVVYRLGQGGIWLAPRQLIGSRHAGASRVARVGAIQGSFGVLSVTVACLIAASPAVASHFPPNAVAGQVSMTVSPGPGPVLQFSYTVTPTPCPGGGCSVDYGKPYLISIYVDDAAGNPAVVGSPTLVSPVPNCTAQGDPVIACNSPARNIDDPNSALPVSGTFTVRVKSVNAPATAEIDVAGYSLNTYQTGIRVPALSCGNQRLAVAFAQARFDTLSEAYFKSLDQLDRAEALTDYEGLKWRALTRKLGSNTLDTNEGWQESTRLLQRLARRESAIKDYDQLLEKASQALKRLRALQKVLAACRGTQASETRAGETRAAFSAMSKSTCARAVAAHIHAAQTLGLPNTLATTVRRVLLLGRARKMTLTHVEHVIATVITRVKKEAKQLAALGVALAPCR